MDTSDTSTIEQGGAHASVGMRETPNAAIMPEEALNEISAFFDDPQGYSSKDRAGEIVAEKQVTPEQSLETMGLTPDDLNTSMNMDVPEEDLNITTSADSRLAGNQLMNEEKLEQQVQDLALHVDEFNIDQSHPSQPETAERSSNANLGKSKTGHQQSVAEKDAMDTTAEELTASVGANRSIETHSDFTESDHTSMALEDALVAALSTNAEITSIDDYPYDGELAVHLEERVPAYTESRRQSILESKVAHYLDEHGGNVVPSDIYEQLHTEAETLEGGSKTISFEQSLTPRGYKRFEQIRGSNNERPTLGGMSPETVREQLSDLDTPAELMNGFFDLYTTNDAAAWNNARIIPEQRRTVDLWVQKLAESLGGDKNNLHDMQDARRRLIERARDNDIDLKQSFGLRHINWLYEEMLAKFPDFADMDVSSIKAENSLSEKEPTATEKISADLAGRQWSDLAPSEQLHLWKGWSPIERKAARTHPAVSGYSPDVEHPDVTEIPGKTGYPNFDILGNGNEGVTGMTPNFDYVTALAKGLSHEDAFKLVYGRDRDEWLESVRSEAQAAGKNPDLINTQLSIYEKKSAQMAVADQDFYLWESPREVVLKKESSQHDNDIESPDESTADSRTDTTSLPDSAKTAQDWNEYFAGGPQPIAEPSEEKYRGTPVESSATMESEHIFSDEQAQQAEGVWKMYLAALKKAEVAEGEAAMKMRDLALTRAETQMHSFFSSPQEGRPAPSKRDVRAHMLAHQPSESRETLTQTQLYQRLSEDS